MINKIKLLMASTFDISVEEIPDDAAINEIPGWDSLNHVRLMLALDEIGVNVPTNKIAELTSILMIKDFIENER